MADNVESAAGSGGSVFATDQRSVDSVHFPLTKLVWGALDTFTLVDIGAGALPVADGGGSLTVDGTVGVSGSVAVTGTFWQAIQPVSGTFWQATQPVSLASVPSHAVTNAGTFLVQSAQSGTWNVTNISGTISLPTGAATAAKQPALGTAGSASSDVITVQGIGSGTPIIVSGAFWQATQPVSLASVPSHAVTNAGTFLTQPQAHTSGGWTPSVTISAASTNATSVKGSAGQVGTIFASNINAAARYLKLYNKATAPTVGSDTPVLVLLIPGNTAGGGLSYNPPAGVEFGTGIAFAITTGAAHADTGAVASAEIVVNIGYK